MRSILIQGLAFALLFCLPVISHSQDMHFAVIGGAPSGNYEGTEVVRTNYICNAPLVNADLEAEGFILLPFNGIETERFNVLPRLVFGSSVELPAVDYAVWPLLSNHWSGVAMRKNGLFYFRFYAPAPQAKKFYFELTSVGVPGIMELCYYDGNPDLPYPANDGSGVLQSQADFDNAVLNDVDFDPDSLPNFQIPDASIFTDPGLSAQVFGQTVDLSTPRLLRTIFSVSPKFVAAATSTKWMNSVSTTYEVVDFVALRVAMMNTISFRETALMMSIEHILEYTATEFYENWVAAYALNPNQGDDDWTEPTPTYTAVDNKIEDESRWPRGWIGSYLINSWANANGVVYDMGHNFYDNAGSGSPVGQVCNESSSGLMKGYVTSGPAGQPGWDMNYGFAMHEIGHVYGARHTFNYAHPSARTSKMAREPGSGLSLMGYVRSGVVNYNFTNTFGVSQRAKVSFSAFDMVFNDLKAQPTPSSAYHEYYLRYHPATLLEMDDNTGVAAVPSTCTVPMDLPQAILDMPMMTNGLQQTNEIPVNTPFVLSVSEDADRLYSWSQNESGEQYWDYFDDVMCLESSTYGPLFLFGMRSTSGDRCFPPFTKMDEGDEYERHFALPQTPRSMTFALTVQNDPSLSPLAHGSAVYDGIKVNVSGSTPFAMTGGPGIDDNELFTDAFGDNTLLADVEVTWDPGNTNAEPIACNNVNIYLLEGDDNGDFLSNATTLASNVPNNGSATVTIPASPLTTGPDGVTPLTARIIVKSPDHIFFAASPKFTVVKSGCNDLLASNYDPTVGQNVLETCEYDNNVNACNHPLACNFNWSDSEESTCIFPLCQDPEALNYEPYFPMYSEFVAEGCSVNCLYEETPCSGLPGYEDVEAGVWAVQGSEGPMDLNDWTVRMGIGNGERLDESQGATRRMEWLADGRIFEIRPSDFAPLTSEGIADKWLFWEIESPVFSVERKVKWKADWATASETDQGGYNYSAFLLQGNQSTSISAFTGEGEWFTVPAYASLKIVVIRQPNDSDTALLLSLSELAHEDKCVAGCTDAAAMNFNAEATQEDGSCFFLSNPGEGFNQGEDEESLQTCLDAQACNYAENFSFGVHTPSMCTYPGCQLPFADNYDPYAGCGSTCCYNGVCADQTWWEAQGRRIVHGTEWTDLFSGDWLAASVIEHLDDVDLQGTGLLIELPPGGMEIEFSGSAAPGLFEMGFALLNFPGNELPSLTWEGDVTFDMLDDPKGWPDMGQPTRDFLLAPQALPFYDDLELPAEKQPTSGFYYRLSEWVDGNAKIVVGPTPAGSNPPALLLSGLVMEDLQICTGEAGIPGCTESEALNFNPIATIDDGTCTIGGCMDVQAVNYDPGAWMPRAECLYEGPCGDLQLSEMEGFGFTGAFHPDEMSSVNRPDLVEFIGDNAVVLSSANEGVSDTTWVEWEAPTSGTIRFAWRYATNDGITYDIPFVSVDGGAMQPLSPGGAMATDWSGTGNETADGLLWQPGAVSLPDLADLPGIFQSATTAYGWMGPVAVEVVEGATVRLGVRTTDGAYGAGHLAVASWVWPHGCTTPISEVEGCTDPTACNYDPLADSDDGSCEFAIWILPVEVGAGLPAIAHCPADEMPLGYYVPNQECAEAVIANDPYCTETQWDNICHSAYSVCLEGIAGCIDGTACNFDDEAGGGIADCLYPGDTCSEPFGCESAGVYDNNCDCVTTILDADGDGICDGDEVPGCTDETAPNFNPNATEDNGSCEYPGCKDAEACNYDPQANLDDGSCKYPGGLCTLPSDCNSEGYYDEECNCVFDGPGDTDGDGICDDNEIAGCTDEEATNFNPEATDEDGSCDYSPTCIDSDNDGYCEEYDCDDNNPLLTTDCSLIIGCTDMMACNYDPEAAIADDSCIEADYWIIPAFEEPGGALPWCGDPTDLPVGYILGEYYCVDLIVSEDFGCIWYSWNGTSCESDYDLCQIQSGCTSPTACNYDPSASTDDGTCAYPGDSCADLDCIAEGYYDGNCDCVPVEIIDADGDGICDGEEIPGCLNPDADNYDPEATDDDPASCILFGCTEETAINFNPLATADDGTCIPAIPGCINPDAVNYNPEANVDDGSCIIEYYGCTDSNAANFDPSATADDGSCEYDIPGCMDPEADNYDPGATVDDGSCEFGNNNGIEGCTDPTAINYDPFAETDDGSCDYGNNGSEGCTDPTAINYDPFADTDDGSCDYGNNGSEGCTDPTAWNYDPTADVDDGSCEYLTGGCTDPGALNYNPSADFDDGSCEYPTGGCTDPSALNFDPSAMFDDGSCAYEPADCPEDVDGDGFVAINDLLTLLSDFGCSEAPCASDIDGDGLVGVSDILMLLASFGDPCE